MAALGEPDAKEVIRSGFEPETHSLEGCCSIQLSYQTSRQKFFRYFGSLIHRKRVQR